MTVRMPGRHLLIMEMVWWFLCLFQKDGVQTHLKVMLIRNTAVFRRIIMTIHNMIWMLK